MAITKNESTKKVKLNLSGLTPEEKQLAKAEAGRIIVDEIQGFLDSATSPVEGHGAFKRKKDGTNSTLFDFGDMRDQIDFEVLETDHVEVGIFQSAPNEERLKSWNHNIGDTLPQRRFVAAPNQRFKKEIMDRVNDSINRIRTSSPEPSLAEDLGISDLITDELIDEILSVNFTAEILGGNN